MVAKIKSGKSLRGALNYNERKVIAERATLLEVRGYFKDAPALTFSEKLHRLTDLAERNHRVRTNTLHVSLNFDPSESLTDKVLAEIGERYMERIGFGGQPYLIYRHLDAGHPHIHIVTTNIDAAGKRISLHNLGRTLSEEARKYIEEEFKLIRAESKEKQQKPNDRIKPVEYGKTETKKAMTNVLTAVLRSYKFASLPEYNAVLRDFNMLADRGSRESVMFKKNGLRYWATSDDGRKLGVPLKASSLYGNPSLKLLEKRFTLNRQMKLPLRDIVKEKVDQVISGARSIKQCQEKLARLNISMLVRRNEAGLIYGLTFVDHEWKVVFNGSDLGKAYSAAGMLNRFASPIKGQQSYDRGFNGALNEKANTNQLTDQFTEKGVIDLLLGPEKLVQADADLIRRKKKRKKMNL